MSEFTDYYADEPSEINEYAEPTYVLQYASDYFEDPRIMQVAELYTDKSGEPFDAKSAHRSYTTKFRVLIKSDDNANRMITEPEILSDARLPKPYAGYRSNLSGDRVDLNALVVHIHIAREFPDDWLSWIVTVQYSTEMPPGGPNYKYEFPGDANSPNNKPWLEKPEWDWDSMEETRVRPFDRAGRRRTNSIGDAFIPIPTIKETIPVLVVTRNFETWTHDNMLEWTNAVNNGDADGKLPPAGLAQCMAPLVKRMWRGNVPYFRVTFRIKIREDDGEVTSVGNASYTFESLPRNGWQPVSLNSGFYYSPDTGTTKIPILNSHGVRVSQPEPLADSGLRLAFGASPIYIGFEDFPYMDMTEILEGVLE